MSEWMHEALHPDYAQALRVGDVVHDSDTGHQRLRVFRNGLFGRVLTLDDVVQTTEGDHFIYHEMMAHVPILAHGAARRVLIVGGGDGGMAREVLRHPDIAALTMVELDAGVIDFSRRYLPALSGGAFDDARFALEIDDGAAFMRRTRGGFDVIIIDSTDPSPLPSEEPSGPGAALFTPAFYADCARALAPGGILVTQSGLPFVDATLRRTLRAFRDLFADPAAYIATIPSYGCGPMAFGWGTNGSARAASTDTLRARMTAAGLAPRYYTPEVHAAAFALPGYIAAQV